MEYPKNDHVHLSAAWKNRSCSACFLLVDACIPCVSYCLHIAQSIASPEPSGTPAHDLALANELGIEFATVKGEVDVKVDTIEGALWSIHTLEIFFQVLAGEIRGQGNDLLDT